MSNPFTHSTAAQRYATARPYYHPVVMARIKAFLDIVRPVKAALDVACGTGQSCRALIGMADRIVGIDSSQEMLDAAYVDPAVEYHRAPAEKIPFPDGSFDLITVSSAFHWFDRDMFLAEARRVLKPGCPMVIYKNGFTGRMRYNDKFTHWVQTSYTEKYPAPPRDRQPFTSEDAVKAGFELEKKEPYANEVMFSVHGLAEYLCTQSNIIDAVENGEEALVEIMEWLMKETLPFFSHGKGTFKFAGDILYLKKMNGIK